MLPKLKSTQTPFWRNDFLGSLTKLIKPVPANHDGANGQESLMACHCASRNETEVSFAERSMRRHLQLQSCAFSIRFRVRCVSFLGSVRL